MCLFELRGEFQWDGNNIWWLGVIYGKHNHDITRALYECIYVGKITKEEHELVSRLCRIGMNLKHVLNHLKKKSGGHNHFML